jgi:hypothetical protein
MSTYYRPAKPIPRSLVTEKCKDVSFSPLDTAGINKHKDCLTAVTSEPYSPNVYLHYDTDGHDNIVHFARYGRNYNAEEFILEKLASAFDTPIYDENHKEY